MSRLLFTHRSTYGYRFEIPSNTGKRKYIIRSGFSTEKEAREEGELVYQRYKKKNKSDNSYIVKGIFNFYLNNVLLPSSSIKESTINVYLSLYNNHISPFIGEKDIFSFSSLDVYEYRNTLLRNGVSPLQIDRAVSLLSSIFNYAVSINLISSSPFSSLKSIGERGNKKKKELV